MITNNAAVVQEALLIVWNEVEVIKWMVSGCRSGQDVHLQGGAVCLCSFLSVFVHLIHSCFHHTVLC